MSEPLPPALRPDYQMMGSADDDAAPATPFRMQRLLPIVLKFWWVPVATFVIGLGAASAYVWWKAPSYVSKGSIWEPVKLRIPENGMFSEDMQSFVGTQTEVLQSSVLKNLAWDRLRSLSNNAAVPSDDKGEPLPVAIRVTQASKSSVFMLEATSSQSGYTQAYLEALMTVYLEHRRTQRKVASEDTLSSISRQIEGMERGLKSEQDILTAFQRSNNVAILEEEGKAWGGYLAKLRTQLSDLQLENRLLQLAASNPVPAILAETNAAPQSAAVTNNADARSAGAPPEYQAAYKEVELLKLQRAKLSRYLRPKHPKIVKLDADIERGEKLIEIFQRQTHDQLAASRRDIQMKIENLLPAIKEWESKVTEANSRMAEGERLKLNVQRIQSVSEKLGQMMQSLGIGSKIDQETLAILEPAGPAKRSFAREISLLAAASVGGLCLGFAIVVLLALRDDRFSSPLEINEKLGEIIFGQVPEVFSPSPTTALPLLEIDDGRHAYAESFRSLRSALVFMAAENERPRVILVTSAVPHEGKSTVAANLARALALGGARVVLVDADLRKGVLHELMHLQREPGLADALRDPEKIDELLQTNSMANLAFIASGSCAGNCGDALLGPAFDRVLAHLRAQFDYVVIDSCPVFAADDATTLAPKMDGTLFVVRSRFSRTGPVRDALALLYQRQARVLGVIFNQAEASQRSNYYYKYAEYYAASKPA